MKYRVVGWTDYDGDDVPDAGSRIGYAERHAIIDEIKRNGYLFSGWEHQEGWRTVPVLNDGKKRCFSQRGWGGVMAEAHGCYAPYDYARFTFYESIDERRVKKPSTGFSPDSFTPEGELAESFTLAAEAEVFHSAKENNPFRINDVDALRYLDAGDTLTLTHGDEAINFFVTDVERERTKLSPEGANEPLPSTVVLVTHDPTKIKAE